MEDRHVAFSPTVRVAPPSREGRIEPLVLILVLSVSSYLKRDSPWPRVCAQSTKFEPSLRLHQLYHTEG